MAARAPLVLLPPSEGKAPDGTGRPWTAGTFALDLADERRQVVAALIEAMGGGEARRCALLGVKGPALAAATATNLAVDDAPTRPAIERYTGVLYDALDAASLGRTPRGRLDRSVLILSGLWGAVAPTDPIPDYKCKMGATLPGLGKLATWWRPRLSPLLDQRAAGHTTWNLLPNEHAAAWAPATPVAQVVVRFLDEIPDGTGGHSLKAVSHWNKLLKGALVRWLVTTGADDPAALAGFEHPAGYRWRPDLDIVHRSVLTVHLVKPAP